ncbi:MAG TPA: O-methyltransferase [Longimicrobiales bacterium]|nr:O-methyltransferase [Longimicrobiales bacterium]
MSETPVWNRVDQHLSKLFGLVDRALGATLERSDAEGLPPIQLSDAQGHFLLLLTRALGAERVLEIGTLGGFSAILLARGLAEGGIVTSLEVDARHAAVARRNIADAGLETRVRVVEGDAHATLARMVGEGEPPFDLIFLDAEKSGYPAYLDAMLALARPGTVIIADNVVREGEILEHGPEDEDAMGVKEFLARVASSPRLSATVIQTVGSKGHDGFLFAVVE